MSQMTLLRSLSVRLSLIHPGACMLCFSGLANCCCYSNFDRVVNLEEADF